MGIHKVPPTARSALNCYYFVKCARVGVASPLFTQLHWWVTFCQIWVLKYVPNCTRQRYGLEFWIMLFSLIMYAKDCFFSLRFSCCLLWWYNCLSKLIIHTLRIWRGEKKSRKTKCGNSTCDGNMFYGCIMQTEIIIFRKALKYNTNRSPRVIVLLVTFPACFLFLV